MYRSDQYLAFIRKHKCLMCGNPETIAHHEPLGCGGIAIKAPDTHAVPLCVNCHHLRHVLGKTAFWKRIDLKMEIIKLLTEWMGR